MTFLNPYLLIIRDVFGGQGAKHTALQFHGIYLHWHPLLVWSYPSEHHVLQSLQPTPRMVYVIVQSSSRKEVSLISGSTLPLADFHACHLRSSGV